MTPTSYDPSAPDGPGAQSRAGAGQGSVEGEGSFKEEARHLGDQAKASGKAQVQQTRESGAESLDKLADAADAAAAQLGQDDVGHVSEYLGKLASGMHRLSGDLRVKSGDEVLRDISRLARENPALFVTGSVAIGLGIGRFARASRPSLPVPADEATPYAASTYPDAQQSTPSAAQPEPHSDWGSAQSGDSPAAGTSARTAGSSFGAGADPTPGTRGGTH